MLLTRINKPLFEASWKAYDAIKILNLPEIKQWLAENGTTGDPRLIGSGGYGWVFKIGDKVVKLTRDEEELKNSIRLMQTCEHPNLSTIYGAKRSGQIVTDAAKRQSEVFLILQDYVDTKKVDEEIAEAADLVGGYTDVEPNCFDQDIDTIMKGFIEYNSEMHFYSDDKIKDNLVKNARMLFEMLLDIYRKCNFQYRDLHRYNIGYAPDGTLKLFDYGLSQFTD